MSPGTGYFPTQDYDATQPAGSTKGYDADDDIRDNNMHVDNAYAVEHYAPSNDPDASEDDFGRHDFITLKEQGSKVDLTGSTDRHAIYAKSDGVYIEQDDGTEILILEFATGRSGVDADIPSGEIIIFESDTAVTGYTLQIDEDDGVVYFTKGSAEGGEEGGTDKTDGTWTQPNHTHTGPSHTHTGPSHTHTGPSHTHTGPSHTHTGPSHNHQWYDNTGASSDKSYDSGGVAQDFFAGGSNYTRITCRSTNTVNSLAADYYTSNAGTGATGADGTGATGASGTGATGADGTGDTGASGTGDTGGSATANTWRPPGRNFTRQARD